jgi:hypothetical protein
MRGMTTTSMGQDRVAIKDFFAVASPLRQLDGIEEREN